MFEASSLAAHLQGCVGVMQGNREEGTPATRRSCQSPPAAMEQSGQASVSSGIIRASLACMDEG